MYKRQIHPVVKGTALVVGSRIESLRIVHIVALLRTVMIHTIELTTQVFVGNRCV